MVSLLWPGNKATIKSMEKYRPSSGKKSKSDKIFRKKYVQPGLSTNGLLKPLLHSIRLVLIHLNCQTSFPVRRIWCRGKLQSPLVLSPGCAYFFIKILSLLLFLAEESRHFSCGQVRYIKDNGTWNVSSRTTHESHLCAMGTQNVIRRKSQPSESTSYSNFTDVTSRALSTSQYKFHSNLYDKIKKIHGQPQVTT
jgi:hypothetical protein